MTHQLDPPQPLHCPGCNNHKTTRSERRFSHFGRFYCDRCCLFFDGTAEEWVHFAPSRAHYEAKETR